MCTTNGKPCNAGKTDAQLLEIITDGNPPEYYLRHLHTMLIGYLRSPIREAEPQHEMAVYDTYTTLKRLLEEMEARGDKKPSITIAAHPYFPSSEDVYSRRKSHDSI